MKSVLFFALFLSFSTFASDCEKTVIGHYSALYHRTYKAASNTFLNNFVGRKNMFAHTFGAPRVAFLNLTIIGENYIAKRIVEDSCKTGQEVYETYLELLRSGKVCEELGEDFKKPRKLRRYLLEHL